VSISRRFTRFSAPAWAMMAVLLAPSLGFAQQSKVVVVPYAPLYDSIPRATGDRIAGMLEDSLRLNAAVDLVKLPAGAEQAAPDSMLATPEQKQGVTDAVAELEKGKNLLSRRRVKPALDAFTKAIAGMEANHVALEEIDPLVEAHLKQAVALFLMGREDEASKGPLPKAIKLQPALRLQAGEEYGQVFVDLMDKIRAGLAEEGLGSLRVDTTPPGAGVWVDGRDAMTSPVMITGLLPGTHYVKIKLPSTDPYTTRVEIKKDETFHISPDAGVEQQKGAAAALLALLGSNQLDAEAQAQVKSLAAETGAEVVVIGGAYASGPRMGIVSYAYDVKREGFIPLQTLNLDRDMLGATIEINKVASELVALLGNPGEIAALPRPMAVQAKAGAEKIHEVDFAVSLLPAAGAAGGAKATTPKNDGPRRPVGGPRVPVGGGGTAPEASVAEPADEVVAVAPVPAPVVEEPEVELDFNFNRPVEEAEDFGKPTEPERAAAYSYAGGVSIADEVALDEVATKKEGGLLTKWWFWTAAGVVAGGAVGIAALSSGGSAGGPTGSVSW